MNKFVEKFTFTRFEPSGMTNHPNIKTCTSIIDFIFRALGFEYLNRTDFLHVKPDQIKEKKIQKKTIQTNNDKEEKKNEKAMNNTDTENGISQNSVDSYLSNMMGDAPPCPTCGHITVRNGACYKCLSCGESLGCS